MNFSWKQTRPAVVALGPEMEKQYNKFQKDIDGALGADNENEIQGLVADYVQAVLDACKQSEGRAAHINVAKQTFKDEFNKILIKQANTLLEEHSDLKEKIANLKEGNVDVLAWLESLGNRAAVKMQFAKKFIADASTVSCEAEELSKAADAANFKTVLDNGLENKLDRMSRHLERHVSGDLIRERLTAPFWSLFGVALAVLTRMQLAGVVNRVFPNVRMDPIWNPIVTMICVRPFIDLLMSMKNLFFGQFNPDHYAREKQAEIAECAANLAFGVDALDKKTFITNLEAVVEKHWETCYPKYVQDNKVIEVLR